RPSRFSTARQGWSGFTGDDQVLLHQFVLALDIVGVERDAVHRADLLALGFVVVADAFGAEVGVDDVDFLALGNGAVRALGLANVAVDAVIGDYQGHPASSSCGVYRSAGKTTGQFRSEEHTSELQSREHLVCR